MSQLIQHLRIRVVYKEQFLQALGEGLDEFWPDAGSQVLHGPHVLGKELEDEAGAGTGAVVGHSAMLEGAGKFFGDHLGNLESISLNGLPEEHHDVSGLSRRLYLLPHELVRVPGILCHSLSTGDHGRGTVLRGEIILEGEKVTRIHISYFPYYPLRSVAEQGIRYKSCRESRLPVHRGRSMSVCLSVRP